MVGRLRDAIRQRRPFGSLEAEAFLNLEHTADALMRGLVDLLKGADRELGRRVSLVDDPRGLLCGQRARDQRHPDHRQGLE